MVRLPHAWLFTERSVVQVEKAEFGSYSGTSRRQRAPLAQQWLECAWPATSMQSGSAARAFHVQWDLHMLVLMYVCQAINLHLRTVWYMSPVHAGPYKESHTHTIKPPCSCLWDLLASESLVYASLRIIREPEAGVLSRSLKEYPCWSFEL